MFATRGYSPDFVITGARGERMTLAQLPPFTRVLLMTDGTLTKVLEAYYWEQVGVEVVAQLLLPAQAHIDWLEIRAGEPVLHRRVRLRGMNSNVVYARADSLIRPSLIPESLRSGLVAGSLGIGELLCDSRMETHRELMEIGLAEDKADCGDSRGLGPSVFRTYRILLQSHPAIAVRESFCSRPAPASA